MELEKVQVDSFEMVSKLKAKVEYIERQWEKLTFEIKENILAQC